MWTEYTLAPRKHAENNGQTGERREPEAAEHIRRLAVNAEQIARYDLPTKPRKETGRRRPDILETVECEAWPAAELRRILRQTIEEYVPAQALAAIRAGEESEREYLRIFADQLDAA